MKTLLVYDSYFGNTQQIAQAIGAGLNSQGDVPVLRAGDVAPGQLSGLQLLVVGSPTRGFRPSEAITEFLKGIPKNGLRGVAVAAFDTRIAEGDVNSRMLRVLMKRFGYAAKPIAARLEKRKGELVVPPEGFFVKEREGPLKEGELERAADWARRLAAGAR